MRFTRQTSRQPSLVTQSIVFHEAHAKMKVKIRIPVYRQPENNSPYLAFLCGGSCFPHGFLLLECRLGKAACMCFGRAVLCTGHPYFPSDQARCGIYGQNTKRLVRQLYCLRKVIPHAMKAFQKMLINVYFLFHDFFSGNHLDHSTVRGLFFKVETVVMSLGVGTNFMRWGIRPGRSSRRTGVKVYSLWSHLSSTMYRPGIIVSLWEG